MVLFSFKSVIILREYHVYKETTWSDAKIDDVVKVNLEANQSLITNYCYGYAKNTRHKYFVGWSCWSCSQRDFRICVFFYKIRRCKWFIKVIK